MDNLPPVRILRDLRRHRRGGHLPPVCLRRPPHRLSLLVVGFSLAFLIGGPVTALPVMGVFFSLFKKRIFNLYLFICLSGSLIVVYVYNFI
jgi:hypothetical protein